jgi:hypothetical protein
MLSEPFDCAAFAASRPSNKGQIVDQFLRPKVGPSEALLAAPPLLFVIIPLKAV